MAQIIVNEISQNYTYNIGTNSFATVALPITACWGPGFFDANTYYSQGDKSAQDVLGQCISPHEYMLENTSWQRFPATQQGLQQFVATYRGPASVYRRAKDYSYQIAMTLLTAGYDVLVCRLCPGVCASGQLTQPDSDAVLSFKAKYPGTFGNNLRVMIRKVPYYDAVERKSGIYWSVITHVLDASGVKTSVENISFVIKSEHTTDTLLHWSEVESKFWTLHVTDEDENKFKEEVDDAPIPKNDVNTYVMLSGGTDYNDSYSWTLGDDVYSDAAGAQKGGLDYLAAISKVRYDWARDYIHGDEWEYSRYPDVFSAIKMSDENPDGVDEGVQSAKEDIMIYAYREWLYTELIGHDVVDSASNKPYVEGVLDLLKDKLAYNHKRVISPGWDDQDYTVYLGKDFERISNYLKNGTVYGAECPETCLLPPSPLHLKLMDVGYYSRCATALIDIPHVVDRKFVHIEDEENLERVGYIQKLARILPDASLDDVNGTLYHTHSALFAPWGQYTYVGTSRMSPASPSFMALMIQRAQILNQAIQYEWALPTNRKHNLRIGKLDYTVPKKILDKWQKLDGVSVNVITTIPDLGTNIWGNSTLFEVPPATYQALANLSTRYLVNAVEDVVYKCGVGITFQYNNDQAYNKFYAGVTPLLDTMKNVGAIEDYYVRMSADINGLDQVNANTVIGKIYLVINGVINDIIVDLIALPPGVDLNQYRV